MNILTLVVAIVCFLLGGVACYIALGVAFSIALQRAGFSSWQDLNKQLAEARDGLQQLKQLKGVAR